MGLNTDLITNLVFNQKSHKFQEIQKTIAVTCSLDLRVPFFLSIPIIGKLKTSLTSLETILGGYSVLLDSKILDVENNLDKDKLVSLVSKVSDSNFIKHLDKATQLLSKYQVKDSRTNDSFNAEYVMRYTSVVSALKDYQKTLLALTSLSDAVANIPTSIVKASLKDNVTQYLTNWQGTSAIQELATSLSVLRHVWERCLLDRSIDPLYIDRDFTFTWATSNTDEIVGTQGGPFKLAADLHLTLNDVDYIVPSSSSYVKGTETGPFVFVAGDSVKIIVGNQPVTTALLGNLTLDAVVNLLNIAPVSAANDGGFLRISASAAGTAVKILPTAAAVQLGLYVGIGKKNVVEFTDSDDIASLLNCSVLKVQESNSECTIENSIFSFTFNPQILSGYLILRIPSKEGSWLISVPSGIVEKWTAVEDLVDYTGPAQIFSERLVLPAESTFSNMSALGFSSIPTQVDTLTIKEGTEIVLPSLIVVGDIIEYEDDGSSLKMNITLEVAEIQDTDVRVIPGFYLGEQSDMRLWCRSIYEWTKLIAAINQIETLTNDLSRNVPKTVGEKTTCKNAIEAMRLKIASIQEALNDYDLGMQKPYAQNILRSFKSLLLERGFDRAYDLLMMGDLKTFFALTEVEARYLGRVRLLAEPIRGA